MCSFISDKGQKSNSAVVHNP